MFQFGMKVQKIRLGLALRKETNQLTGGNRFFDEVERRVGAQNEAIFLKQGQEK